VVPLNATVAIVSGAVPVFVSVTVCCPLVTLTNWLLKFNVVATDATGAIPVPFSVTVWVVGLALSVTVNVAVRPPVPLGVNVRITTHDPVFAATDALLMQVVPAATMAKSLALAPLIATAFAAANCTPKPPVFDSVTVRFPLVVPTFWFGVKFTGLGAKFSAAVTPDPDRATDCFDPATAPESSVITRVTGPNVPTAVGANVTLIVHVPRAGMASPFVQVVPTPIPNSVEFVPTVMATALVAARFKVSVPLFVNVNAIVEVWLIGWFPNARVAATWANGAIPVPDNATDCVVGLALSVNVIVAVWSPKAVGAYVSFTTQLAPASTVDPLRHVVPVAIANWFALVPPKATVVRVNGPVPPLLSVRVCAALAVFSRWFPNAMDGLGESVACGKTPTPDNVATWVVGLASSANVIVADWLPSAVGVNVRFTIHVAPAATVEPFVHVVPVAIANWFALVPPSATVARFNIPVPLFIRLSVCTVLVTFRIWFPKLIGVEGVSVTAGNTPVPVKVTVWGLPEALSTTDTVAPRLPNVAGVNVTATVQVPPNARETTVRQSGPLTGVTKAKSAGFAPVKVTLVMARVPVPEFVNVEVDCAVVVANLWFPNGMVVGFRLTPGCVPFPDKVMTW
jgi:hypothetical protein